MEQVLPKSYGVKTAFSRLLTLLFLLVPAVLQAQVAAWDFNTKLGNEITVSPSTTNGNVSVSDVSRGAGLTATALSNGYSSSGFTANGTAADAVNSNKYLQFSIKANTGYQLSLSTLNANFRRSSTGPNKFQWQYSLDGFTTAGVAIGSEISYTLTTTNGDAQTEISLSGISGLQNLSSSTTVTFRLYGYGATATGGTFALGRPTTPANDLALGGTVSSAGGDTTPPANAANYPAVSNKTESSFTLLSNLNETGKTYYVVLPSGGTAPTTAAQVKAGTNGSNAAALKAGSFSIPTANTETSTTISGLSASSNYIVYVVSEDGQPNLQTSISSIAVSTSAPDITEPANNSGYPKTASIGTSSVSLVSNLNETGKTYYVLIPSGGTAPTTSGQIKQGVDGAGQTAFKSGTITIAAASTDYTASISGLSANTSYTLFVVSEDNAASPNLQSSFSSIPFTTASTTGINNILISQYYEGTGTNKWIELTNAGATDVNTASTGLKLALYNVSGDTGNINFSSASIPGSTVSLTVNIPAYSTVLIGNSGNQTEIPYLTAGSAAQTSNTVINFNGNDGVALLDADNNILDAFGQGVNAKDVSYVRSTSVKTSTATFNSSEWTLVALSTVQEADEITDANRLGSHLTNNIPSCAAPSAIASNLTFGTIGSTSIAGSFTATSGVDQYLIVRSTSATLSANPVNGTSYLVGDTFGNATVIGQSSSTSFTASGLNYGTNYYFFVFSASYGICLNGPVYRTSSTLSANASTLTPPACAAPTAQPTGFTITEYNYNSINGSFTAASADEHLVVMSVSSTLNGSPVNGTTYAPGQPLGDGKVIKRGTGNTFSATGLEAGATYYFYIYALNSNCTGGPLYLSSNPLKGQQTTGPQSTGSLSFYKGNLHAHSSYSDGNADDTTKTPADDYAFAKNSQYMDFLGISEHNHSNAGMSLSNWQPGINQAANATSSTFVGMYGMEWGTITNCGHVVVYGVDSLIGWEPGNYQIYVPRCTYRGINGLFSAVTRHGGNAIAYLAHPSTDDYNNLAASYDESADVAVVGTAVESGPAFSTNTSYSNPSNMSYITYYNTLLSKGYHVGPTVDHDNHNLTFGRMAKSRLVILSPSLTQNDLLASMKKMRFYATEDYGAQVTFTINNQPLGSIMTEAMAPNISVSSITTQPVSSIKIMYGVPGSGQAPTELTSIANAQDLTYTHTTLTNLSNGYYYADITELDGTRTVTAPIWYTRNDGTVLPVSLQKFEVKSEGSKVAVRWITSAEQNNSFFTVERSQDGRNFFKVLDVKGAGTSNQEHTYSVSDQSPFIGINYYRLRQTDFDGRTTVSQVKSAMVQIGKDKELSVYPNPSVNYVTISYKSSSEKINLELVDLTGKSIFKAKGDLTSLNESLNQRYAGLPTGNYILRLSDGAERFSTKLIKQ